MAPSLSGRDALVLLERPRAAEAEKASEQGHQLLSVENNTTRQLNVSAD
jgi:hypothetical protein